MLLSMLPRGGKFFCVLSISEQRKVQTFHVSAEEAMSEAAMRSAGGWEAYVAMASFNSKNRKAASAVFLRSLWLDLDCGDNKPFANHVEAAQALRSFIKATGLPDPTVVNSGGGLHVYWVMDEDVRAEAWHRLALALKEACTQHGFHADPAPTADVARVLRPTGTMNYKRGVKVSVLRRSGEVSPLLLAKTLKPYAGKVSGVNIPATLPPYMVGTSSKLSSRAKAGVSHELADPAAVASGCQQIKWAIDNPDLVSEPLWYNILGVASACLDPERTAVKWSKGHSGFDEVATLKKLDQWVSNTTGPATCASFESLDRSRCEACAFRGKITSPAGIAGGVYANVGSGGNDRDRSVATSGSSGGPFNFLSWSPPGFVKLASGYSRKTADGNMLVCDFDVYPVLYGKDESLGYEVVKFRWHRKNHGWCDLDLRQALLVGRLGDFATAIADQGVVLDDEISVRNFMVLLRGYLKKLRDLQSLSNMHTNIGWKDGGRFVLGTTSIEPDNSGGATIKEVPMASGVSPSFVEALHTKGQLSTWSEATKLLTKHELMPHTFALGLSLASPLYNIAGLAGSVLSLYGPTGTGKTLSQLFMQSVWGDPTELGFGGKFTQNVLFHRLGILKHLPMTIDEATMMDLRSLGDFCYWVSQGRDKARLTANINEREVSTWNTSVTISTNKSLSAMLASAGYESEASAMRMVELEVANTNVFSNSPEFGRLLHRVLTTNYGFAGREFMRWCVGEGRDKLTEKLDAHFDDFQSYYNVSFAGAERFWAQKVVLVDFAIKTSNAIGITHLAREKCMAWTLEQLDKARVEIRASAMTLAEFILQYINNNLDSLVSVSYIRGRNPSYDPHRLPRNKLLIRLELNRPDEDDAPTGGTLFLERSHFRKTASDAGLDWIGIRDTIEREGMAKKPSIKRYTLGKHTSLRSGQQHVLALDLAHPSLHSLLVNSDTPAGASNVTSFGESSQAPMA